MTTYFNMISGFCRYNPAGPEKAQQEQKNGEEVAQPKTCCEEIESLKEPKSCGGGVKHDIRNLDQWDPWDPVDQLKLDVTNNKWLCQPG